MYQLLNQLMDSGSALNLRAARAIILLLEQQDNLKKFIAQETHLAAKYPIPEVQPNEEHF